MVRVSQVKGNENRYIVHNISFIYDLCLALTEKLARVRVRVIAWEWKVKTLYNHLN